MFQLLVFDMDDVIVDTEYLDFQLQQAFVCLFSSSPNELSQQDFSILVGKSYTALYRCIKQLSQTSLSLETIIFGNNRSSTRKVCSRKIPRGKLPIIVSESYRADSFIC